MTLEGVLTELATRGALKQSRVPAMKTSLKYLASALGHASLEQCPADAACRQEATWATALEDHWRTLEAPGRTISAYTRRNVRNDIRKIFTLAEASGLLTEPLPSLLLPRPDNREAFRREQRATAPYKRFYGDHRGRSYWLPQREWSPELQDGWQAYRVACGGRIRETSFASYVKLLETYWGYVKHVCDRTPTWDDVFDKTTLMAFVSWHGARVGRPLTVHARQVVIVSAAMAVVLKHPHAPELAVLRQGLKKPAPLHNKRHHMVSLAELEAVADSCLAEGRAPLIPAGKAASFPGKQRAGRFQRGVILKLLVRVPLRQRNIREMRLDRNLWKDQTTGHWHLEFAGDELKIGSRGSEVNTYEVNLSAYRPEFVPILEEWLQVHRPKLPNAATSPFVFLTQRGNPHISKTLHGDLSEAVAMRTQKRFFPHIVRTMWATEFLRETQDFQTAATMLGDQLKTVIDTYYHVVHKEQIPKASNFLDKQLRTG
jgi:Phage integrase family